MPAGNVGTIKTQPLRRGVRERTGHWGDQKWLETSTGCWTMFFCKMFSVLHRLSLRAKNTVLQSASNHAGAQYFSLEEYISIVGIW